jgi:hypothetical protein
MYVHNKSDMPTGHHFAIIEFTKVYVPGDERSRTNPGHGYPSHTESVVNYRAFTDRGEWEKEISKMMDSRYTRREFIAVKVTPAEIETKHSIKISV